MSFSCAASESPFSYEIYNTLRPETEISPKSVSALDQTKLAYYAFSATQNKERAAAILYHGGGAYSTPAYQWVAQQLAQQGISTYCFDIRGHGNSAGRRGDAPSVNLVLDDIGIAINVVKKQHPTVPVYLIGHSSGAGLLINYHHQRTDPRIAGYIMLAPYLGPQADATRYTNKPQSFVKSVRVWVFILNALLPVNWFNHFDAVYFNYPDHVLQADPKYVTTYSYVMSSATTPYEIKDMLAAWDSKPLWVFIGDKDEQFLPDQVVTLCKKATPNAHIIPDAQHLSILEKAPQLIADAIK